MRPLSTVSLTLPSVLVLRLDEEARHRGISRSQVVRQALSSYDAPAPASCGCVEVEDGQGVPA